MILDKIKQSYINVSGKIYDSEFINLANVKENKVCFDERTLFLTNREKEILNSQELIDFNYVIYLFKYKDRYGLICDIPINEYNECRIKYHELVLPDTVQGMISNLNEYNCEAAPVLLAHKKKINYLSYIEQKKYDRCFNLKGINIYVFKDTEANSILKEFLDVNCLYVADGHHRLYTTAISKFKNSVLACLIDFESLDILPIHRVIPDIDAQAFKKAKDFICKKFNIEESKTKLSKGKIRMTYNEESFVVNLIELDCDAFSNNDIYMLNTQIISQAFRIFDSGKLEYLSDLEFEKYRTKANKQDVLIETFALEIEEFIDCINNNCIMPPKSTWFYPKFPSFLVFKQYK
ncbi:Uncharacterized conserved protein, DUF1015 family [Clostridium cavendishii DSM 21758]|uniref:Uncharacterized conserved protein, DUF1015 family n=1 Tax=Clostridium cavendishii DSM 21758 TaxID=1121302 RepID=A0A1M6B038_9CLOT|nr:DUF1015 family protein [Clostridium cavendishii]SHI42090.1 Uncharacterized conserved protein, DUF1015 family [Clostridium cavendishii DSM 21758]